MPHKQATSRLKGRLAQPRGTQATSRYSVALPSTLARQVETYADTSDISVSKAVAALVRLGLDSQEVRKREFFKKLRKNLANHDPKIEDQMVDEFRALILGH
jgi:glucose-6-phosphate-specific signal transduction histidine kinase